MKTTVTEIVIHPDDENPVFGINLVTRLHLDDEGAGRFLRITQELDGGTKHEIRLDFIEVDAIYDAIKMLEKQDNGI